MVGCKSYCNWHHVCVHKSYTYVGTSTATISSYAGVSSFMEVRVQCPCSKIIHLCQPGGGGGPRCLCHKWQEACCAIPHCKHCWLLITRCSQPHRSYLCEKVISMVKHTQLSPRRACARVTVLGLCVCVCPAPRRLPLHATERPTEGTYGFAVIWETF